MLKPAIQRTAIEWVNSAKDSEFFLLSRIVEADDDGVPLETLESGDLERDLTRSRDLVSLTGAGLVVITGERRAVRTSDGAAILYAFIHPRRRRKAES